MSVIDLRSGDEKVTIQVCESGRDILYSKSYPSGISVLDVGGNDDGTHSVALMVEDQWVDAILNLDTVTIV